MDNIRTLYICGNHQFSDEILEQHKNFARQCITTISIGKFDKFEEKVDSITKKIAGSDAVFVYNKDGKIDKSTQKQIFIAQKFNKKIIYFE